MARMTRSQSRELETPSDQDATKRNSGPKKASVNPLPSVREEERPETPGRSTSKQTDVVPESPRNPEGHSTLSGTTVVHHVSDSEDGEPDALDLVDELPDLQHAALSLLDLLTSNASDPISIFNAAKRTRDTDAKRFKRHSKKLLERMKVFANAPFIDAAQVEGLIPSVRSKDGSKPWNPSPTLHIANCARLALDILLESVGSKSASQAIRSLETEFPAPFMNQIANNVTPVSVGTSAAEKATFELALEIRTQFSIMELERCQNEPEFDPRALLMKIFYSNVAFDLDNNLVDTELLRGFKLASAFEDENGILPGRFQEAVTERIRELEVDLFDDDDALNIKGLRAAFSWKRFVLRTASFIYQRDKELRRDLQTQPSFDEIKGLVIQTIQRRDNPTSSDPTNQRGSIAPGTPQRPSQSPFVQGNQGAPLQPPAEATPERQRGFTAAASPAKRTPQKPAEQGTFGESHANKPAGKNQERRKRYLDWDSIKTLAGRTNGSHEQDLSNLESQHKGKGPEAADSSHTTPAEPSSSARQGENREEIPQTQDSTVLDSNPGDNSTLINDDDSWILPGDGEEVHDSISPRNGQFQTPQRRSEAPQSTRHQTTSLSSTQRVFQDIERGRQMRKQNGQQSHSTIFDRQSDARRVSPIRDSDSPSVGKPTPLVNPAASRKRTREEIEDSDDDFDVDTRNIDTAGRRAQKPQPERRVRQRTDGSADAEDAAEQLHSSLDQANETEPAQTQAPANSPPPRRQSDRVGRNTLPLVPVNSPPPRSQNDWTRRNATNRRTAHERGRYHKWTPEQDERLIQLIGRWGCSWAKIEREDEICPPDSGGSKFEARRASYAGPGFQMALKDRARTLKRKWEREGTVLPLGFHKVTG